MNLSDQIHDHALKLRKQSQDRHYVDQGKWKEAYLHLQSRVNYHCSKIEQHSAKMKGQK